MKTNIALIFLLLFHLEAFSQVLLKDSKVLSRKGLKIVVGEAQGNSFLVPLSENSTGKTPKVLLGIDGGLHQLRGSMATKSNKELMWSCYEGIPTAQLTMGKPYKGNLALLGNSSGISIKWTPGVKMGSSKKAPSCLSVSGFNLVSADYYSTANPKVKIVNTSWSSPTTDFENCPIQNKTITSFLNSQNECILIAEDNTDCDGQSVQGLGVTISNFEGTLILADGTDREVWMIFKYHGYEWTGFVGFLVDSNLKIIKKNWYTYKGC